MRVTVEAVTPNADGRFVCVHCGDDRWLSAFAAATCCDTDYEGEPGR